MVSEFKDFIAVPKFNLYQSLHTAVARARRPGRRSPHPHPPDAQGRRGRRHRARQSLRSSVGGAAADGPDGERVDPTRPGWLSRLLDWQEAAPDPDTFWSTLREDLAQDREITVFRPDGGTLGLPEGASCVDAAYAQYGEDAHACIGARVNGRLATLSTVLKDGDTVQLLMGQDPASEPSREWLEHAHTPAARIAIQRWLATHPSPGDRRTSRGPPDGRTRGRGRPPGLRRAMTQPAAHRPSTAAAAASSSTGPARPYGSPAAVRPYRPTRSPASPSAGEW